MKRFPTTEQLNKLSRRAVEASRDIIVFLKQNPGSNCDEIWAATKCGHGFYPQWCMDRKRVDGKMVYFFNAKKFEARMSEFRRFK